MSGSVFAASWGVCIDKQYPEAPGNFKVSGNVLLSWDEAKDLPISNSECTFGIDYYKVYLDGKFIGRSDVSSYSGGALSDGNYIFEVSAVDKAGNEGKRAIKEVVFPLSSVVEGSNSSDVSGSSGGSGGRKSSSNSQTVVENSSEGVVLNSSPIDFGVSSADFSDEEDFGSKGFFSFVTGAVIGGGVGSLLAILFFIALVLVLFFIVKKKEKESVPEEKVVVAKVASSKKKSVKKSKKK